MWQRFLHHPTILSRPFLDLSTELTTDILDLYSDASKNEVFGFGATCNTSWMFGQWEPGFIKEKDPSIEYLELFGLLVGVMTWGHHFCNRRIVLFCDNQSVVQMVNQTTASCKNCMVLIRLLVLESLVQNIRVFACFVRGKDNYFSDALSRMNLSRFRRLGEIHHKEFDVESTNIPAEIWPISKLWIDLTIEFQSQPMNMLAKGFDCLYYRCS